MQPKNTAAVALLLNATHGLAQSCPSGYTRSDSSSSTSVSSATSLRSSFTSVGSTATSPTSTNAASATPSAPPTGLNWTVCDPNRSTMIDCATLRVPLDYTASSLKRDAKMIDLPLVRIPAVDADGNRVSGGKSVIVNPGGPGESGIDLALEGGSDLQSVIGIGYNIIGFDPRGVGLTEAYKCPVVTYDSATDPSYSAAEDGDGSLRALRDGMNQAQKCAEDDYKAAGQLVGTAFVARDIMAIANALGEDGLIRYIGYSYGTLLGATVAAMFPDKIDRMYLDGNIDPTDYYHGDGSTSLSSFDSAVAQFFDLCADATSPYCPLANGQSGSQLLNAYAQFLADLDANRITAKDSTGSLITAYQIKEKMFNVLYSPTKFIGFAIELNDIYKTKTAVSTTSRLAKRYNPDPWTAKNVSAPNAIKAISGGDYSRTNAATLDRFRDLRKLYISKSNYGGESALGNQYSQETWLVDAKERFGGSFKGIETKTPILFVNTLYDPVTPLDAALSSSSGFLRSVVKRHSGVGHCSNQTPSKALNADIAAYFASAKLPDVSIITNPDDGNPFRPSSSSTSAATKLANLNVDNIGAVDRPAALDKAKRDMINLLMRQSEEIPSGCVPVSLPSSTQNSPMSSSVEVSPSMTSMPSTGVSSSIPSTSVEPSSSSSLASSSLVSSSPSSSLASSSSSLSSSELSSSFSSFSGPVSSSTSADLTSSNSLTLTSAIASQSSLASVLSSKPSQSSEGPTSTSASSSSQTSFTTQMTDVSSTSASRSLSLSIDSQSTDARTTSQTSVTASGTATPSSSASIASTLTSASVVSPSSAVSSSSVVPSSNVVLSSIAVSVSSTSASLTSQTVSGSTLPSPSADTSVVTVDGTTYAVEYDVTYAGSSLSGQTISKRASSTFATCLSSCARTTACVGAAYSQNSGSCTLYQSIVTGSKRTAKGITFATVVERQGATLSSVSKSSSGSVASNSGTLSLATGASSPRPTVVSSRIGTSSYMSNATSIQPSTTVWVTSVVNVCPTGLTTSAITVTATCPSGCSTRPSGIPQGFSTTTVFCSACAIPQVITVTTPVASPTGTQSVVKTGTQSVAKTGSSNVSNGVASSTALSTVTNTSPALGICPGGSCPKSDLSSVASQASVTTIGLIQTDSVILINSASRTSNAVGVASSTAKLGLTTAWNSATSSNSTLRPTMAVFAGSASQNCVTGMTFLAVFFALFLLA
ncbi:hypothetical protein E4T47_07021 [Aureobasidium subglaciale]|nr:hypothetical protein E4T47_07021 [Aureobasidium subglaciale]